MKGGNDHFVISRFRFGGENDKTPNGHFWLSYRIADSYVTIMGCTFCSFSFGHCIVLSFDLQLIITPLISSNNYNQCEKKVCCCKDTFWHNSIISLKIYSFDCLSVSRVGGERSCIGVGHVDFVPVSRMSPLYFWTCSYGVLLFHFHINVENHSTRYTIIL
jgi:hypothetical protein